jgi:hypothetical protein
MEQEKNSAAKFAFYYLLSLVALVFMALSVGMIIFEIINKYIVDILEVSRGLYSSGALKFAISALIISSPIYYLTTAQINKNLFSGKLEKDSGIRKWLSYLILLVSSIVMLGFLVGVIYNFLDGELTVKFILKALTAIIIAGAVFSYYFYDIKRLNVLSVKDKIIKIYFFASLVVVLAALVSAFIFVESPAKTRKIKHDNAIINQFSQVDSALNTYYSDKRKLPGNFDELFAEITYLRREDMKDPATGKEFEYKVAGDKTYELCSTFLMSTKDNKSYEGGYYFDKRWDHDAGYQCLRQKISIVIPSEIPVIKK